MKNKLLILGAISAAIAPIAIVVSCGSGHKNESIKADRSNKKPFPLSYGRKEDGYPKSKERLAQENWTLITNRPEIDVPRIGFIARDSSGASSPTRGYEMWNLPSIYANLGDLSSLSDDERKAKITESYWLLIEYLNSIDDWKYEYIEKNHRWEVYSQTFNDLYPWTKEGLIDLEWGDPTSTPSVKFVSL